MERRLKVKIVKVGQLNGEEKETHNYLFIEFIVTLYSLQKNTRFLDQGEQKVTTNPKLGQNHKSRSIEEEDL